MFCYHLWAWADHFPSLGSNSLTCNMRTSMLYFLKIFSDLKWLHNYCTFLTASKCLCMLFPFLFLVGKVKWLSKIDSHDCETAHPNSSSFVIVHSFIHQHLLGMYKISGSFRSWEEKDLEDIDAVLKEGGYSWVREEKHSIQHNKKGMNMAVWWHKEEVNLFLASQVRVYKGGYPWPEF